MLGGGGHSPGLGTVCCSATVWTVWTVTCSSSLALTLQSLCGLHQEMWWTNYSKTPLLSHSDVLSIISYHSSHSELWFSPPDPPYCPELQHFIFYLAFSSGNVFQPSTPLNYCGWLSRWIIIWPECCKGFLLIIFVKPTLKTTFAWLREMNVFVLLRTLLYQLAALCITVNTMHEYKIFIIIPSCYSFCVFMSSPSFHCSVPIVDECGMCLREFYIKSVKPGMFERW